MPGVDDPARLSLGVDELTLPQGPVRRRGQLDRLRRSLYRSQGKV